MNLPHPQPGQKTALEKQQGPGLWWWVVVLFPEAGQVVWGALSSCSLTSRRPGLRDGGQIPVFGSAARAGATPTIMPTCTVPELCS